MTEKYVYWDNHNLQKLRIPSSGKLVISKYRELMELWFSWTKVFKNEPFIISGIKPLKKLRWLFVKADCIASNFNKGGIPQILAGTFLGTYFVLSYATEKVAKIVNDDSWWAIFIKSSIVDVWQCPKYTSTYKNNDILSC